MTVHHSPDTSLAILGEFGLISRISADVSTHEGVITGIGDDAAVTSLSDGMQLLTSTDMLLEDVHFRRSWHEPYRLGRKALAVSISDIAAMGGIPRWALLSLGVPANTSLGFIDDVMRGFLAMAAESRVTLVGGDTCFSPAGLSISVTIMGEQYPKMIVRRAGAGPDDDIWVTGTLGDAALGLKILEDQCLPHPPPDLPLERGGDGDDFILSRFLNPTPRVSSALALAEAGLATAMIDISDGILADFGHIAEQSGVGGSLQRGDLPLSAEFRSHSARCPLSFDSLPLTGGEDYELCFTAHCDNREKIDSCMKKCGIVATRIGIVTSSPEVIVVNPDGSRYNVLAKGFNHFT
ncbi:MAG: thiamine-phosphate kinase [Desulfuromonadaceae bacterium]|nr:thiamine-phosphate kinase [Desulfuromonadaceae bacterium]MDD5104593.1 thiamine-phosphate kinase [Desulfuromonadaceae bacterium]